MGDTGKVAPGTRAGTPCTFPTRSAGIWPASGKAEAACPTEVPCTGRRGGPYTSRLSPSRDLNLFLELGFRAVSACSPRRLRMEEREGEEGHLVPGPVAASPRAGALHTSFLPACAHLADRRGAPEPHFVPPVAGVGAERFPRAAVVIFQQRKGPHPHLQESVTVDCLCFAIEVASLRPFLEVFPIRECTELGGFPLLPAQRGQSRPGDPGIPRGGRGAATPASGGHATPASAAHRAREGPLLPEMSGGGQGSGGLGGEALPGGLSPPQRRHRGPNGGRAGAETLS